MNVSFLRPVGAFAAIMALTTFVSAATPTGRYTYAVTDVTVYDTKTKLTWQRTAPSSMYAWADAKTYCVSAAVSTALGGTGWRLPTIKELESMIDYSQSLAPMIDANAFPGTPSVAFWSSSLAAGSQSSYAWYVTFSDGNAGNSSVTVRYNVRCVR